MASTTTKRDKPVIEHAKAVRVQNYTVNVGLIVYFLCGVFLKCVPRL